MLSGFDVTTGRAFFTRSTMSVVSIGGEQFDEVPQRRAPNAITDDPTVIDNRRAAAVEAAGRVIAIPA